jgi:hypothetical protein
MLQNLSAKILCRRRTMASTDQRQTDHLTQRMVKNLRPVL